MSPAMTAPLLVLAVLLVTPGRLPGERSVNGGVAPALERAQVTAQPVRVSPIAGVARSAGAVVRWVLYVP